MKHQVVHFEVTGKDGAALQSFYGGLFGWQMEDVGNGYGLVPAATEGGLTGGVGATSDGSDGMATFYVGTDSVAGSLAKAEELGGSVVFPEMRLEENGIIIGLFADPEGHVVGVVQPIE